MSKIIKQASIDPDLADYEPFFDHDWGKRVSTIADQAKALESIVFDLAFSWKGASSTAHLPGHLMHLFNGFAVSFFNDTSPNTRSLRLVKGLTERLAARLPFDTSMRQQIHKAMLDIDAEIMAELENAPLPFSAEKAWSDFVRIPQFQHCIWACQRICYVAVYNAYEDFITRCVGVALGQPEYRMQRGKEFSRDFRTAFGDALFQSCWADSPIAIARLARHALSHAGGRETEDLNLYRPRHEFEVRSDEIQVKATNTRSLFECLKDRSFTLVEKAASMPEFK